MYEKGASHVGKGKIFFIDDKVPFNEFKTEEMGEVVQVVKTHLLDNIQKQEISNKRLEWLLIILNKEKVKNKDRNEQMKQIIKNEVEVIAGEVENIIKSYKLNKENNKRRGLIFLRRLAIKKISDLIRIDKMLLCGMHKTKIH